MTDQDTTAQLPPAPPPPGSGPRRLLRSRNDRVLAGVAGGLGRYFGVDPVIVRIAFAVSVLFGGLGAFAYIALALFVPTAPADGGEIEPAPIERSRGLAIAIGIGVVVIALSWGIFSGPFWGHGFWFSPALLVFALVAGTILIARRGGSFGGPPRGVLATLLIAIVAFFGLSILAVAAAWAGATGHGVVVAGIVIAIGVLLALSAFSGGARWLIAPALALAVPLGAVAAADIRFADGVGEREYRPLTATAIPADGYRLGIGRLAVDMRDLDWKPDSVVDLGVDLGVGEAVIAVPSNVCVTTDVDVRGGSLRVAGDEQGGVDVHSDANQGATATPRLVLTGEVDLGDLQVINDDAADIGSHGERFHYGQDSDRLRSAMTQACATSPTAPVAPTPPGGTDGHGNNQGGRGGNAGGRG